MYYILYLSAVSDYLDDDELQNILSLSRKNNQMKNITGVLLYGNGQFIQLLEGDRDLLDKTFQKIKLDPRHLDITVIASGNLEKRCFPEWYMGFKPIRTESKEVLDGFLDLSKTAIQNNDCDLPVKLLQSFVRKNRLDNI